MAFNYEGVGAAILTRLENLCGSSFVTYSRTFLDLSKLQAEQQPALMLIAERYINSPWKLGTPNVWMLYYQCVLYNRTVPSDPSPETKMNALIGVVVDALLRIQTEPFSNLLYMVDTNLGGTVERVSIKDSVGATGVGGTILLMPGTTTQQSASIVPLEVLMTK